MTSSRDLLHGHSPPNLGVFRKGFWEKPLVVYLSQIGLDLDFGAQCRAVRNALNTQLGER